MISIESIILIVIVVYTIIILYIYAKKYKDKTNREFKNKDEKKKLLYLLIPVLLMVSHLQLVNFIGFYNDTIQTLGQNYDQRFYIINKAKFTKKYLVVLSDKTNKKWIPYYRSDYFRLTPVIEVAPKSQVKLYTYLDKNNIIKYDKMSIIYLNDNSNIDLFTNVLGNDTLMNSISFALPSPPLKIYSTDFYKNTLVKKLKINNTFEYIKLLFYILIIPIFLYLMLMSRNQYLKYLYWLLNAISISACFYVIYEIVLYLLLI